jgi:hypothetical protein
LECCAAGRASGATLLFFLAAALGLWLGTHWMAPQLEWGFVREHPRLWAAVMLLYPVLSVYPQGILSPLPDFRIPIVSEILLLNSHMECRDLQGDFRKAE